MKRAALILAIVFLLTLAACGRGGQNALRPTEAPAAAPTEAPSEAPTEAPAEAPTPEPTETPEPGPTQAPDFSALVPQTGRLCEGPIFPEPGKYLVLSAGGALFLVYDNMGELIKTFSAVDDEYAFGYPGIYGEDGICKNVRISTGESVGWFSHFGDMVFTTNWVELEDGKWTCYLEKMRDTDFNELFSLEGRPEDGRVGSEGGVLHVGEDYLILDRHCVYHGSKPPELVYDSPIRVIGPDGAKKGEIDPALFPRQIMGVFGGKYLICGSGEPEMDPYYYWESYKLSIWDLDGSMLMDKVHVVNYSDYTVNSEGGYGVLLVGDYLEDEDGNCYGPDLERVVSIPEGADRDPFYERYGSHNFEDYQVFAYEWSVFQGIKDSEGNWLFRIYNPRYASDNIPGY